MSPSEKGAVSSYRYFLMSSCGTTPPAAFTLLLESSDCWQLFIKIKNWKIKKTCIWSCTRCVWGDTHRVSFVNHRISSPPLPNRFGFVLYNPFRYPKDSVTRMTAVELVLPRILPRPPRSCAQRDVGCARFHLFSSCSSFHRDLWSSLGSSDWTCSAIFANQTRNPWPQTFNQQGHS